MDFVERIMVRITRWEQEAEELLIRGEEIEAATLEACIKDLEADLINGHSFSGDRQCMSRGSATR